MTPYETLYRIKCKSPTHWDEVGKRKLVGPKILEQTSEVISKIQQRMKVAQDRQKSYTDNRRKDLSFEVGDNPFKDNTNEWRHEIWKERKVKSVLH